jgi:hypothetical protein
MLFFIQFYMFQKQYQILEKEYKNYISTVYDE